MTKRMINFGEIKQFRNTIYDITHFARYERYDEELDKVIYNTNDLPVVEAEGSEKIHGCNMAVCFSNPDGFWVQSRNNIITAEKDNAGCAFIAHQNERAWLSIIHKLAADYNINLDTHIISVFAEWCGGSIQKKSALTDVDKSAMIFKHFKVSPIEKQEDDSPDREESRWLETNKLDSPEARIFNIGNYPCISITIDFNSPQMSQNKMIEDVAELEQDSPVGRAFGKEKNVGEGRVYTFLYRDTLHRFKVKGEKHSATKVKTMKPVDEAFENKKIEFVNNHAIKGFRLEQMWQNLFGIDNEKCPPDVKKTGEFLSSYMRDVIKEESDIMASLGLTPKDVSGMVSNQARKWFMDELNKAAGL